MTIIQKINIFLKKRLNFWPIFDAKIFQFQKFNPFILISFLFIFSIFFFILTTLIEKKIMKLRKTLKKFLKQLNFQIYQNF